MLGNMDLFNFLYCVFLKYLNLILELCLFIQKFSEIFYVLWTQDTVVGSQILFILSWAFVSKKLSYSHPVLESGCLDLSSKLSLIIYGILVKFLDHFIPQFCHL